MSKYLCSKLLFRFGKLHYSIIPVFPPGLEANWGEAHKFTCFFGDYPGIYKMSFKKKEAMWI